MRRCLRQDLRDLVDRESNACPPVCVAVFLYVDVFTMPLRRLLLRPRLVHDPNHEAGLVPRVTTAVVDDDDPQTAAAAAPVVTATGCLVACSAVMIMLLFCLGPLLPLLLVLSV